MNDTVLVFIHIPKTAGTTFRVVADRQYLSDGVLTIYGDDILRARQVLANLSDWKVQDLQFVRGHISFGCHEAITKRCRYVTVLRDPAARILSLFKYIQRDPTHPIFEYIKGMSFLDFVRSGISLETDNAQVRQLCGTEGEFPQSAWGKMKTPFASCSRDMLERAKRNLREYFDAVGISERFYEFLSLSCYKFGWTPGYFRSRNVSGRPPFIKDLPLDVVAIVRQFNLLDVELHKYAEALMEESLNECSNSDGFRWIDRESSQPPPGPPRLRGSRSRQRHA